MTVKNRIYVWAKPRREDWSAFNGGKIGQGQDFQPCCLEIDGDRKRLTILAEGSQHEIEDFEIGPEIDFPAKRQECSCRQI
jgi:hypothetical protein